MSAIQRLHGRRRGAARVAPALAIVGMLVSSLAVGNAVDTNLVRGVCVAKGPLRVVSGNQVRFSAKGFCGPLKVEIVDFLGPFEDSFPTWTGGCNYGPPLPRLRLAIFQNAPAGGLTFARGTFWNFPELIIGNGRAETPNWISRLIIRDIVDDPYGRPTEAGAIVGQGTMLARLVGDCDFRRPGGAQVLVTFVLYGDLLDTDLPLVAGRP